MDHVVSEPIQVTATPHTVGDGALGRASRWLQRHSIRVRLYSVVALLFLLVIGLGIVGFVRLSDVNRASEVIRNHWLRDTRVLGDLNNYMSDYRAAEATRLLSSTPAELAANDREIETLRDTVAASQRAYEEIDQDLSETALFQEFSREWAAYQTVAARVIELARSGQLPEAVTLYNADSRKTFDLSSDTLSRLTEQTVVKAREDSDRATTTYWHARSIIVTAMILAASLVFGVIIYITRVILAPLLKLVACMHELANHNTDIPIPSVRRDDDIGKMARAVGVFRDNAVALAESQQRLIAQAAALEDGLEHERRLTAQQRDFIAMTSHEFLTPLTIIDGHAQRLIKMSDRLDPSDIAERGASIRRGVQRITDIMDSLLGASREADVNAVYNPVEFDPFLLIREVCQAHRDANRTLTLTEAIGPLPASIYGDPKLLFHALSNLISNAIKYSPLGSPVEMSARREAQRLVIQVRDHGIGIPVRDREHLFERYFRGSNATGVAGTGVGLHLVSMVVNLHQGEVCAESLEGEGSRFTVSLPMAAYP
jgi:two-component system, OmpR family, sensor kinase